MWVGGLLASCFGFGDYLVDGFGWISFQLDLLRFSIRCGFGGSVLGGLVVVLILLVGAYCGSWLSAVVWFWIYVGWVGVAGLRVLVVGFDCVFWLVGLFRSC